MKCEELQYERIGDANKTYPASTLVVRKQFVDEAIAELNAENERLSNALDKERSETIKYMDELCNAKNEIERLTIDKRNVELRADVADSEQTVDEWSRYKEKHPFGSWRADPFEYWVQAWIYVEKICRKKAEAYK